MKLSGHQIVSTQLFPSWLPKKHGQRACRRVISSPHYQTGCASSTSTVWSLHNLNPLPWRRLCQRLNESSVLYGGTRRDGRHCAALARRLIRRNTTTVSLTTQTGSALSASGPRVPPGLSIYHSKVLFCSPQGSAAVHRSERRGGGWCRPRCFPTLPEGFKEGLWRLFKVYGRVHSHFTPRIVPARLSGWVKWKEEDPNT